MAPNTRSRRVQVTLSAEETPTRNPPG